VVEFQCIMDSSYLIQMFQFGFKETFTYFMYVTGAFSAGWILSAVVSVIESIPLVSSPKIMRSI
jgi:hypothetical protein